MRDRARLQECSRQGGLKGGATRIARYTHEELCAQAKRGGETRRTREAQRQALRLEELRKEAEGQITMTIPLTQGYVAIVDAEDYSMLALHRWQVSVSKTTQYARRTASNEGKPRDIQMHRLVMQAPDGMCTDHINHNGLDNRKANLRLCTRQENNQNQAYSEVRSSTGVPHVYHCRGGRFNVQLRANNKLLYFGAFHTLTAAAETAREAVKRHMPFATYAISDEGR